MVLDRLQTIYFFFQEQWIVCFTDPTIKMHMAQLN